MVKELIDKFQYYSAKLYPDGYPKVKKGDRLACDNYLLMATDILRYLMNTERDSSEIAHYAFTLYSISQWYEEHTRWNFDFTLRQAELYTKLFLFEDSDDLYKIKDLKGNQYDTLSHIFYKNQIQVSLLYDQSICFRKSSSFYQG
jgi:hypothetical protein